MNTDDSMANRFASRDATLIVPVIKSILLFSLLFIASAAHAQYLVVGSYFNNQVIRYDSNTGALDGVLVPNGTGGLNRTEGIACPGDGYLYVASENTDQVLRYEESTGTFVDVFVTAGSGGLDVAAGMVFGPDGHLYVSSYNNDSVMRYHGATGAFIDVFAQRNDLDSEGVAFGPDGNLYVASYREDAVFRFDGTTGDFIDRFVTSGSGGLDRAVGLIFGPDGNLYVASEGSDQVLRYNGTTGAFMDVFASGGGLDQPFGLIFGPDGHLYVGGWGSSQVHRYNGTTGASMGVFASGGGMNGAAYLVFCGPEFLKVNPGMNDAWFNPTTAGQGVFIVVFPLIGKVFIAMFTFDTELPGAGVMANLGSPGHRWFTAFGDIVGNTAILDAELTAGGIFNSAAPMPTQTPNYGTVTLTFQDCRKMLLTYSFPGLNLSGDIDMSRIVNDNVFLCVRLQQAQPQ